MSTVAPHPGPETRAVKTAYCDLQRQTRNNHGKCDMAGTKLGEKTKRQIEAGKVLSVNAYKTRSDKNRP